MRGEIKLLGKNCHSATSSTTNPTLNGLRLNPCFHCKTLASNRLTHGTEQ
jgi:hypothetical protein